MIKILQLLYFFIILIWSIGVAFSQESSVAESAQALKQASEEAQKPEAVQKKEGEEKKQVESVLSIKETGDNLYSIELRNVELKDFFRVIAHDYNLNILVDENIQGKVTASLTNISLKEALERIAEMNNLVLKKEGNVIIVKPNLVTRIFILKHVEAESLLEEGAQSEAGAPQEPEEGAVSQEKSYKATIYDLLSPQGKVLLGKYPNSIMVIDYPENIEKIATYIKMIDKGMESKIFKLKYIRVDEIIGEEKGSESESTSTGGTEEEATTESGG